MENGKIIEAIVDKINAGYDVYGIEKFLEHQEINSAEFDTLIETANTKILEHKLKTYPKQNKLAFILSIVSFLVLFILFTVFIPSLNIGDKIIPLSILGAMFVSLSGFYALMYYKSWEKSFIEKVGKPKFDLGMYFLIFSLPTVLFYFIIYGSFINGSGHNFTKLYREYRFIKYLLPK